MSGRGGFAKVFSSLWEGTLYGQGTAQLVFVYLLANCDAGGVVDVTPQVIAGATGFDLDAVREALRMLEAEDPESRTPDEGGRRIVLLDEHRSWGWRIVNYGAYRARLNEEERRVAARERMRRVRGGEECERFADVRTRSHPFAQAEAEAEAEADTSSSLRSEESAERRVGPESGGGVNPDSTGKASSSGVQAVKGRRVSRKGSGVEVGAVRASLAFPDMPVVGGGTWAATEEQVEAWRAAFPGIDVGREWAAARAWLLANPARGKTARGMAAYVNRWLAKAQDDSGRGQERGVRRGHRVGADERYIAANGGVPGVLKTGGENG